MLLSLGGLLFLGIFHMPSVIYNRSMFLSLRLLSVVSTCSMLLFINYPLVYFQLFHVCCYPLVGIH